MRVGVRISENSDAGYQLTALAVYRWLEEKNYHPTMIVGDGWVDGYILQHCDNVDDCNDAYFDSVVVINDNLRGVIGEPLCLLSAEFYRYVAKSGAETKLTGYIKEVDESDTVEAKTCVDVALSLLLNKPFTTETTDVYTDSLLKALNISDTAHIDFSAVNREINNMAGVVAGRLTAQMNTRKRVGASSQARRHGALIEFKIQNLFFPDCDWKNTHWWMMYRGRSMSYNAEAPSWTLESGGIECFTYLNALSVKKWNKYTNAASYKLHLRVRGIFEIHFFGRRLEPKGGSSTLTDVLREISELEISNKPKQRFMHEQVIHAHAKEEIFNTHSFDTYGMTEDGIADIELPVEYEQSEIIAFSISCQSPVEIFGGCWVAMVDKALINNVNIAICTTTFKKEEYILSNLGILEKEVFGHESDKGMDGLSKHLFVNVVDNGRTLDAKDVESANIRLYHNPNTGGAGGFSRGMIETIGLRERGEFDASHVLFMDDDIKILPESLNRTYALLSLLKNEYRDRFISGAMLDINAMNEQYEDLGFVTDYLAMYSAVKPRYFMHLPEDVLRNEVELPLDHRYAAWWYCCAPIKFVNRESLSLPIFYRGDDIEFSLRNNADFITLNGICVWHLAFAGKLTTSLEYYLVNRNCLVTQAISGIAENADFIERIKFMYNEEIRKLNYSACEHLLDAIDDFLKGPEYIAGLDGEAVIKSQAAKNEKLLPIESLGIDVNLKEAYEHRALSNEDMATFIATDNGHTLPDDVLRDSDKLPVIAHLFFETPGKQFLRKRYIAVDAHNKTAIIRVMSKAKYAKLTERKNRLFAQYEQEKERILSIYKDYSKKLHSEGFWRGYLGLRKG